MKFAEEKHQTLKQFIKMREDRQLAIKNRKEVMNKAMEE